MAKFIHVITIAYAPENAGPRWLQRTHEALALHLRLAARYQPDLIVLPEMLNCAGLPVSEWIPRAEPIPGPTYSLLASWAAEIGSYICAPLLEEHNGHLYNTAAFIARDGSLLGKYHKMRPTLLELEQGIVPGAEAPVFETDFGKIGAAICFDLNFSEVGAQLAAGGARLVCFPSQTRGGERLLHWARDFGFYLISSYPERSYIVDMAGRFITDTGWEINQVAARLVPPLASAVLNMDRMLFHLDGNQDKFPALLEKYGPDIELEIHYPEAHFTLASLRQDVTVEDLIEEFSLEPWTAYLARCRRECQKASGAL